MNGFSTNRGTVPSGGALTVFRLSHVVRALKRVFPREHTWYTAARPTPHLTCSSYTVGGGPSLEPGEAVALRMPPLVYSVTCWWAFGCLQFGDIHIFYKWSCCAHWCTSHWMDIHFFSGSKWLDMAGACVVWLLGNCQIVFAECCTILHFRRKYLRVLVPPQPHQHSVWSVPFVLAILMVWNGHFRFPNDQWC